MFASILLNRSVVASFRKRFASELVLYLLIVLGSSY